MNTTTLNRALIAAVWIFVATACGNDDVPSDNDRDSGPDDDGGRAGSGGRGGRGGTGGTSGRGGSGGRGGTGGDDMAGRGGTGGGSSGTGGTAGDDEDAGEVSCSSDADCDDDDACTTDDCASDVCVHTAVDPDDNDECTTDSCDEDTGVENAAVATDDNNMCTTDSCDPATGVAHTPVATDDSDMCTTDACNPATGAITHTAVATDDSDMCTTDSCVPATGVMHVAVATDDSDMCTTDACDPATGVSHTAVATDDSDMCTTDACDPATGVSHTPVAVDDSDGCTADSCTSPGGAIVHAFCTSGLCDTTNACFALTTTSVTDPAALPLADLATVTDTIVIAGAGTRIWDVNVRTSITHTYPGDLDITLTSPAGTIVTLTTDNGVGNDNVFNGTTWNDSANPGGALPYATNNGLVTDQAYVNLTPVAALAPEEPLGAFMGEDPNGTWTLTIVDDEAVDTGNLASWGLDIVTISAAPTVAAATYTQGTATPLTDNAVVTSTIVVPVGAGLSVCSLTVNTDITHASSDQLDVTLTSPAGTIVTLTTDNGGTNDNVFSATLWNDDANPAGQVPYANNNGLATDQTYVNLTAATPLAPEEALSSLIGEAAAGTWTLTVSDDAPGQTGSLNSWALNIGRCLRGP